MPHVKAEASSAEGGRSRGERGEAGGPAPAPAPALQPGECVFAGTASGARGEEGVGSHMVGVG
jgi:hypothetical protein